MQYHFRINREPNGYWAQCLELDGCSTEGNTVDELERNAKEALDLYLQEPEDSSLTLPLPDESDGREENVIAVAVDPRMALAVLLRHYRGEHHYTQKQMAQRLNMNNLYSYQRLERRSNPRLETLQKLKRVFPDLSIDYLLQE